MAAMYGTRCNHWKWVHVLRIGIQLQAVGLVSNVT